MQLYGDLGQLWCGCGCDGGCPSVGGHSCLLPDLHDDRMAIRSAGVLHSKTDVMTKTAPLLQSSNKDVYENHNCLACSKTITDEL